jgi:hypothetical protein
LGHKTKKIKTFRKASSGGKSNFPKIPQFKTILKSKKKKNVIEVSQWVDKHSPQTKVYFHFILNLILLNVHHFFDIISPKKIFLSHKRLRN